MTTYASTIAAVTFLFSTCGSVRFAAAQEVAGPAGTETVAPIVADTQQPAATPAETPTKAEPELSEKQVKTVLKLLEEQKVFRFGAGVGFRWLDKKSGVLSNASLSPKDWSVQVDERDPWDFVISSIVVAEPFKAWTGSWASRLGFLVKINIAEFNTTEMAVSKSIEGGMGLSYQLHPSFLLGFTVDRVFSSRLRPGFEVGKPILVDGMPIKSLEISDRRFFEEDNLTAVTFQFCYVP